MVRRVSPEVLDGFFSEVRGYLPRIQRSLDGAGSSPPALDELEEAYRLTHSIKGTASMVNLQEMSRVAGVAELILDEVLNGNRAFDTGTEAQLLAAVHNIHTQLPPATSTTAPTTTAPTHSTPAPSSTSDQSALDRSAALRQQANTLAKTHLDSELAATVTEEFQGYLETIGTQLRGMESDRTQVELLSEMRRPLHTMKGTAGIVGMADVSQLTHRMEDLLTDLDQQDRHLGDSEFQLLFQATDLLSDMVAGEPMTDQFTTQLDSVHKAFADALQLDEANGSLLAVNSAPSLANTVPVSPAAFEPQHPTELLSRSDSILRVRADRLDGVLRLLGDVTLQRSGFDRQVTRMNELRGELQLNLRRLGRMARQLTAELDSGGLAATATSVAAANHDLAASEFDSLEMDRYTKLNLLARQLEEAAADSAAVGSGFESLTREVEGFQTRMALLTRDMQERLTQLRTVRFDTLSSRLHRTVRVTAEKRNKQVTLTIEGGTTELDKNILEEIAEPLLHLLRNAVDHGIEPLQARRAAGKSDHGTITIQIDHRGTEAIIRVQDDGAGLDLDRLRHEAAALGFLTTEEAEKATPETLHPLILQRGFSTAPEVSEVSGRGIGLDVVNTSISQLRGLLEVESEPGTGTTFTIRLPGSQSILRVLLFATGGETLAVPLATIERVESATIQDLQRIEGQQTLATMGESLRALETRKILGMPPLEQESPSKFAAIILQLGNQRVALLTERILGVQEVVARPLSEVFSRRLFGLGGAALTGDGHVVLVLNPRDLTREPPATDTSTPTSIPSRKPEILIVDDSLSVRQILSRLMERHGWQPLVARNGQDALELLGRTARIPDVALVDLEMPHMDGYELTRTLKSHAGYRQMPIVILTTRAGEKHRRKAFELGATDYLIKPYNETTLLEALRLATGSSSESRA